MKVFNKVFAIAIVCSVFGGSVFAAEGQMPVGTEPCVTAAGQPAAAPGNAPVVVAPAAAPAAGRAETGVTGATGPT